MQTSEPTPRKQYLDGEISHREYYALIVKKAGIVYAPSHKWVQGTLQYLQHDHYDSNTIHLNWIPLAAIDRAALIPRQIYQELGDCWSLAGNCCAHKEAIKQAVEKITGKPFPTE